MKCSGEGDKSDMRKEQVLSRMREECLIAVIRAKNPEQGEKIVEAVIAGGIHFIEITMTMEEGNPVLKAFGIDKEKNVTIHEIEITE